MQKDVAMIESLESRTLFNDVAATPNLGHAILINGNLTISPATAFKNKIIVQRKGPSLVVKINAQTEVFSAARVKSLSIFGSQYDDIIDVSKSGRSATISGFEGNDTLTGSSRADTLFGGVGNDLILGGSGNDSISGDTGNDVLLGDNGNDILTDDPIASDFINQTLTPGQDIIRGGNGKDTVLCSAANQPRTKAEHIIHREILSNTEYGSGYSIVLYRSGNNVFARVDGSYPTGGYSVTQGALLRTGTHFVGQATLRVPAPGEGVTQGFSYSYTTYNLGKLQPHTTYLFTFSTPSSAIVAKSFTPASLPTSEPAKPPYPFVSLSSFAS